MAEEEPREIQPIQIFDPQAREPGDFRPVMDYDEDVNEAESPDPKDSSAQEPAESSDLATSEAASQEPSARPAPVEKVSTQPKVPKPGSPTSSSKTKVG